MLQFVWANQEDYAEETAMSNSWYEVLSVLHLMAMLSLSQANILLLSKKTADSYQSKVSEESRRASIDIFLKAAGYLDFAVQLVLPQFPPELRKDLPLDLAEGVLQALSLQALGHVYLNIWHPTIPFVIFWSYSIFYWISRSIFFKEDS
ncbi:hypothetical protein L1049_020824 [Liquidambar formosana]|uniref:Uncharacterized protein n=1 Tax=Liquidambar formosana TaxID=63359 RepID=A0AAP0SBY3_LIQFO